MKRLWIFLLLYGMMLLFLSGCSRQDGPEAESTASGETDAQDLEAGGLQNSIAGFQGGAYQVKDFKASKVYALSSEEIYSHLDTVLLLTEDIFCYNGHITPFGQLELGLYAFDNRDSLEEAFQVSMDDWIGERDSVKMIPMTSPSDESFAYTFGSTIFLLDGNEDVIWVYWEGVFFLLERLPYSEMEIVEDQTFDLELNDFGQVTFISCMQQNPYLPAKDAMFYLARGEEIVYAFPYMAEFDPSADQYEECTGVECILLTDYDKDGDKDVIAALRYVSVYGDFRSTQHLKFRIFKYVDGEYMAMLQMSKAFNDIYSDDFVIGEPAEDMPIVPDASTVPENIRSY